MSNEIEEQKPDRVWLRRVERDGHMTLMQSSGHDEGETEYVRADGYDSLLAQNKALVAVAQKAAAFLEGEGTLKEADDLGVAIDAALSLVKDREGE